jgi:hypothetical protein
MSAIKVSPEWIEYLVDAEKMRLLFRPCARCTNAEHTTELGYRRGVVTLFNPRGHDMASSLMCSECATSVDVPLIRVRRSTGHYALSHIDLSSRTTGAMYCSSALDE